MDGGLQDSLSRGLSEKEAAARLKAEGPNTLPQADRRTFIRIVLEILREPMFALLLGAAAIYLVLGDLKEAVPAEVLCVGRADFRLLSGAVAGRLAGLVDWRFRKGGASTLATQTEKFRHSPAGRLLLPSDAAAYVEAAKTCDNH